ncbi:MAG: hypothetical protein K2M31_04405, partial [Muribaculaceae bacterium]|nr:hypothetical protein [Muribaculaceae bacterium]
MKYPYLSLWLLLAIGLIIIIAIAFADDINIGEYTLRKAPFRENLLVDHEAEAREEARQDSIIVAKRLEMEEHEKEERVDSTAHTILLIGDSMTWNLAYRFAQYAKTNGHTFHAVNWDSSGTVKWAKSHHLSEFIEQYGASYVFICLGSNELYIKDPKKHLPHIQSILDEVGDLPYVWIGPPNWKEDYGINDLLEATCVPGGFFRSEGMKFERKKDGIHPTRKASEIWVDSIARWMPKSSHPILMETPPE